MIQLIKKNNYMIIGATLLVMLFAQVYPYFHFHHTHNDNDLQIIVSSHAIDHESNNHSGQHNGEHHHEDNEHIGGNWHFVKSIPRLALKFSTNSLWITNIVLDEQLEQVTIVQIETNHPPPEQVLLLPSLSRAPPAHLS